MPDFWTHIIAGEEIVEAIEDSKLKELLKNNYQLFNFGCQGADFFFYHNFWPWHKSEKGPKKGDLVHQLSGKKLFVEVLTAFKREGVYHNRELPAEVYWQQNIVYLTGFISHFALDRACHPYIIENGGAGEKHKLIEAAADIYLMEKKWDQNPARVNPHPYYQLREEHTENLDFFYQQLFGSVIEEKLDSSLIWDSYLDLRKYHQFFYAKAAGKYYLLKSLNFVLPQDLRQHCYALNKPQKVWSENNFQQFEEKYNKGVESALELIEQTLLYFDSELSLTEVLKSYGDLNFVGEKV